MGGFGDVAPGESASNSGDRFQVQASSGIGVGRMFSLRLVMRSGSGEQVWDFPVTVGRPVEQSPLGPDRYGYYAYDDVDVGYAERPQFEWVEIDPTHGGSGTEVNLSNDTAVPVQLPFTFRFYGRDYNTVSICDNGYLAMGSTWLADGYNWSIPSPMGPDGMVAVFWDDFRTDTLGASGVYYWYDASHHQFFVQWSRCVHVHGFRPPYPAEQQTFQVTLSDPHHHPTRTGDGPIVVQYLVVQDDDTLWGNNHNYATVGIAGPDHRDGLQCTFAGIRPAATAPIIPNRAIRFTTNPPDTFTAVREQSANPGTGSPRQPDVSPSVTRGKVWLSGALLESSGGIVAAQVFDALGREMLYSSVASRGEEVPLDLGLLPGGVYHLVLTRPADGSRLLCTRIIVPD
jgi:hypothetical protein